jgi:hypothetical protein
VLVRAAFQVRDINEIDDEAETFEFGGWRWAPTMWRP